MDKTFSNTEPRVINYVHKTFRPKDEVLEDIKVRSAAANLPAIQVGLMDGLHLEVLTRAFNAKKAVEIGTLGGYSGVCIARGLPDDGKLYTIDFIEQHVNVAKESFKKAGVAHKVETFWGKALEILPNLSTQGPFDLVFIDADKINYPNYLEWAVENIRVGGVILGDNTFAWGKIDAPDDEISRENLPATRALRTFNQLLTTNPRLKSTILPTGEGLTVSVKVK